MRLQLILNHPTPSREEGTLRTLIHFKPIPNYLVSLIDYLILLISVAASVGFFLKSTPTLWKGHWIYCTTNNTWWDECGCSVELRYILLLDRSDIGMMCLCLCLCLWSSYSSSRSNLVPYIHFLTCLTACIYARRVEQKACAFGKGFELPYIPTL